MKEITLALGSGGAKGNAHLGVLRVLEREGFSIRALAGTSAGALWGVLYAYGYTPDEIQAQVRREVTHAIFSRAPDDAASWLGLRGVRAMLEDALGDATFEDLQIPFAVTAVDLVTAERIVFNSGRLVEAVLASISVPGVFPPHPINGRLLIDGGILDPVPVTLARSLAPNYPVVAVVLSPGLVEWRGRQPRLMSALPFLLKHMSAFRFSKALNLLMQGIDISGALLVELSLQIDPPDVLIRPEVRDTGLLDFSNANFVALQGEAAAEAALPALHRAFSLPQRLLRRLRPATGRQIPYATRHLPSTSSPNRNR